MKLRLEGREPTHHVAGDTPAPRVENDGALLRGAEQRPSLTGSGHASFLVQLGGASLLIDPILSPRIVALPRLVAPASTFEALPTLDAVLIAHNHRDHMDAPTLSRLSADARYIVPKGLGGWFAPQRASAT